MLCQARKADGSYCNNPARFGSKTCYINKHIEQFKRNVQKGGWGGSNSLLEEKSYAVQKGGWGVSNKLLEEKSYAVQKGGWGNSKVSWFGGFFN